jgi:hypothetical protein
MIGINHQPLPAAARKDDTILTMTFPIAIGTM